MDLAGLEELVGFETVGGEGVTEVGFADGEAVSVKGGNGDVTVAEEVRAMAEFEVDFGVEGEEEDGEGRVEEV